MSHICIQMYPSLAYPLLGRQLVSRDWFENRLPLQWVINKSKSQIQWYKSKSRKCSFGSLRLIGIMECSGIVGSFSQPSLSPQYVLFAIQQKKVNGITENQDYGFKKQPWVIVKKMAGEFSFTVYTIFYCHHCRCKMVLNVKEIIQGPTLWDLLTHGPIIGKCIIERSDCRYNFWQKKKKKESSQTDHHNHWCFKSFLDYH